LHDSFVTVDETWCFQYDHQRKRQRMEWRSSISPRQRKFNFISQKTKWCWSHSSTVGESFRKKMFHQVGRWIRNIMWKYYLVWSKEFIE
jgi:hypothetical protein